MSFDLARGGVVVYFEDLAPALVTQLDRMGGRLDEIRVEHNCEGTLGWGSVLPGRAGHELLDRVGQHGGLRRPQLEGRAMRSARTRVHRE